MVGTRQLERVLSQASDAGAKVVLVGDPQQLQSIEAGAAARAVDITLSHWALSRDRMERFVRPDPLQDPGPLMEGTRG